MTIVSRIRRAGRSPATSCLLALACSASLAQTPAPTAPPPAPPAPAAAPATPAAASTTTLAQPPAPAGSPGKWFDVSRWPLIPVPLVGVDPDSGVTLGILPTWLHTNDQHEITRIIAPDLLYNPDFGVGGHFRVFEYPSADEQWSVQGGIKQRVEREFDYEFEKGRLRDSNWSINTSLVFDRAGTPRFYGVGNRSADTDVTNYTANQLLAQVQVGYNFSHTWQLQYAMRARRMEITAGTLADVTSIQTRYPDVRGLGFSDEVLNQLAMVYDTRDDSTVPSRGGEWVAYAGVSGHSARVSDSVYTVTGVDGRNFFPILHDTIVATHVAVRYLPSGHKIPFFDLSSIGGDESDIGGEQPLRGFGQGRFVDRNSFSASVELRHRVFSFDAAASHVDLELTPFVDMGQVSSRMGADPFSALHKVVGIGVRGVARPSVVGYVDVGYGTEGIAVFTGIDYPF